MQLRVTNSSLSSVLTNRIAISRRRLEVAQEQISTGKKINRPSDNPFGAAAVTRLRSMLSTVEGFQQNAATVNDGLRLADGSLESYQQLVDRASTLMTQGASDSSSVTAKKAIASELDGIRKQMLSIANLKSNDRYVFGGTRQDAPPFDALGNPAVTSSSSQLVQIEPDAAPIEAGLNADTVFQNGGSTIFATIATVVTALRGTGDPVADKAAVLQGLDGLATFSTQSETARSSIGASMVGVETAKNRLESQSLLFLESVDRYELADIAQVAIELTQASNALEATLQASAFSNKGSLMDLIG